MSGFLSLKDEDFHSFIRDVEKDPIFLRLVYPRNKEDKAIGFTRPVWLNASPITYSFSDKIFSAPIPPDLSRLLKGREGIIKMIRKMGEERFSRYFLYNEEDLSVEDISHRCGVNREDIEEINTLINDISIYSDFFAGKLLPSHAPGQIKYSLLARLEKTGHGGINVSAVSLSLARGRYRIDMDKIKRMRQEGGFGREEKKRLTELLRKLNIINLRKSLLFKIIEAVVSEQEGYILTGDKRKKKILFQKDLARRLDISTSWFTRLISGKSLLAPWGEEISLKSLFPSKRLLSISLLQDFLLDNKEVSDGRLIHVIRDRFSLDISRRTVASYRKNLGLVRKRGRKKADGRGIDIV